jgi:hypothetical protein
MRIIAFTIMGSDGFQKQKESLAGCYEITNLKKSFQLPLHRPQEDNFDPENPPTESRL